MYFQVHMVLYVMLSEIVIFMSLKACPYIVYIYDIDIYIWYFCIVMY